MRIKNTESPSFRAQQEKLQKKRITQKLSYIILDLICSYLVSNNKSIRTKGYNNIKELISILDPNDYKENADLERLDFIKFGLDARLKFGLIRGEQVKDYIMSNDNRTQHNINIEELSNKDVKYVNDTVTNLLDGAEFANYIHIFDGISREFDNANSYRQKEIINHWKNCVNECSTKIRTHKIDKSEEEFVSLREGIFEDYASDVYIYMSNTSSKLSTGMTGFNYLLGGGFENGRVYSIFGLQGEGKSTTLLNIAFQIKMYNNKYKTKDPTKKPAVVYLTLENTKRESFSRLFSISTDAGNIIDYDSNEGIQMMRNNGLIVNDDNPIDLIIKYKPNNSVTTSYLYELADDLAEYNYEVVAYVVDYINVIRSIYDYRPAEERLRLGSVINEFKSIAAEMDIPILTAGQMNREANKNVDNAREKGDYNLAKYTDRSNLGESMLILNNLDGSFIITPSFIGGREKYLSIKLIKARYTPNRKALEYKDWIYQPYESIDSIRLKCDIGEDPKYLFDLAFKKVECEVDESVNIPDNSRRFNDNPDSKPAAINPIVLYEDGTKPRYDVFWRTNPSTKNGIVNINGICPEKQLRFIIKKEQFKNVLDPMINSLNGISRYSDTYTKLYDPEGSKEERLAHDFSIKYNRQFTEKDFPELYSHFVMLQNKEIPDSNIYEKQELKYKPEVESVFIKVPNVDREALLKHLSPSIKMSN